MRELLVLVVCIVAANAVPYQTPKIIGGAPATVSQYPSVASLLFSWDLNSYWHACGGSIITTQSVLTAAHCVFGDAPVRWRVRVGSSYANSRGAVYSLAAITNHQNFSYLTLDSDIAIVRLSTTLTLSTEVKPATVAGTNYVLQDNQVVWAVGWGTTTVGGAPAEQLRHVQIWTVNQNTCAQRYATVSRVVTGNMVCSGWLDVGGRDQCQGDSGGPLYHNGVVVGICSWGQHCALPYYPGVNTRVSKFTAWIQANA